MQNKEQYEKRQQLLEAMEAFNDETFTLDDIRTIRKSRHKPSITAVRLVVKQKVLEGLTKPINDYKVEDMARLWDILHIIDIKFARQMESRKIALDYAVTATEITKYPNTVYRLLIYAIMTYGVVRLLGGW